MTPPQIIAVSVIVSVAVCIIIAALGAWPAG